MDEALDSVLMHDVMKIFLKFSEPVWPKDLHGMIMAGKKDFLVPEGITYIMFGLIFWILLFH